MHLRVEVFKGEGKHPYYVRLRYTVNGQVLMTSEGYRSKWYARNRGKLLSNMLGCEFLDDTIPPYKRYR